MEKIWLKSYPPGVPAEIDPSAFDSLNDHGGAELHAVRRPRGLSCRWAAEVTYRELDALTRDFAAWLQNEAGLQKGDRVAHHAAERPAVSRSPSSACCARAWSW